MVSQRRRTNVWSATMVFNVNLADHIRKSAVMKALEVQALKDTHHQNISRMFYFQETADKFYLVLEFAPGGELFDYIVAREKLKENEARQVGQFLCLETVGALEAQ